MTGPSPEERQASVDSFLRQADIARQKHLWDDAVRIYQVALLQIPDERRFHHGLAQVYGAKADHTGLTMFHQKAMDEYWRLIHSDPSDEKAHDALLAATVRSNLLGEVMEEYRSRMKQFPDVVAYANTFKKIQTLYFLKTSPVAQVETTGFGRLHKILTRGVPLVAFAFIIVWVVLTVKIGPRRDIANPKLLVASVTSLRIGLFLLAGSLTYQIVRFFRSS